VPGKADVTSETKATDGFQTPSKKHQVPATSLKETATAMEGVIVTNNPYLPLTSLGMTRSRGTSPKKVLTGESPQKKKTKVNPAFMQAMDDAFAKQKEALDSGLDEKLPGKEDVGLSLIEMFNGAVKAVVAPTGLGTDEAIQDDYVTGERNWQDSWENSSNSKEKDGEWGYYPRCLRPAHSCKNVGAEIPHIIFLWID
jgi:hypothetical protein